MWLAGEFGRRWIRHSWQSVVLVGGAILNVIDGGQRPRPPNPPRTLELQSVLQSLPEAAFLFNPHSCVIGINKAAEQLTGESRDELLGMEGDSPYFTTKAKGTGLGLSGARRAIQAQGAIFALKALREREQHFSYLCPSLKTTSGKILKPRECRFSSAVQGNIYGACQSKVSMPKAFSGWTRMDREQFGHAH